MMDKLIAEIPLGRIARPEQIAALVALLVSPLGSHMTGTTIPIDGGQVGLAVSSRCTLLAEGQEDHYGACYYSSFCIRPAEDRPRNGVPKSQNKH